MATDLGQQRAIDRVAPQRGRVAEALRAYEAATLDPPETGPTT